MVESRVKYKVLASRVGQRPEIANCISAGERLREMPEFSVGNEWPKGMRHG